jgi:hypothetical protein
MVKVFVLVKMVIITTKPCQHVPNVILTVLLVLLGMIVPFVPHQELETIVYAQIQCGITITLVKIVIINAQYVL